MRWVGQKQGKSVWEAARDAWGREGRSWLSFLLGASLSQLAALLDRMLSRIAKLSCPSWSHTRLFPHLCLAAWGQAHMHLFFVPISGLFVSGYVSDRTHGLRHARLYQEPVRPQGEPLLTEFDKNLQAWAPACPTSLW